MTTGFNADRLEYLQNLIVLLENVSPDDPYTNEDYIHNSYKSNDFGNEMNNKEVSQRRRKKKMVPVSVQIDFDTDEFYIPWLWGAERKIEDFCAQLCNLLNTLHQSRKGVLKTKSKATHSLATQDIKNTHPGKSNHPSSNSTSGYIKPPVNRSKSLDDARTFELIENTINYILKEAMELKNSIPKFDLEETDSLEEQIYEAMDNKRDKETNIPKLERSKSSLHETRSLPMQSFKIKRGNTMPIINESKSEGEKPIYKKSKPLSKITRRTDKIDSYSVPKTKNIANSRNTASETSSHSSKSKEKNVQLQVLEVPTKDTGAIPKTRIKRETSSSTTTRAQKTKKTNVKPLWR